MITSPCFNCSTRHKLCHTTCEPYKAFRAKLDAQSEIKQKHLKAIDGICQFEKNRQVRINNAR